MTGVRAFTIYSNIQGGFSHERKTNKTSTSQTHPTRRCRTRKKGVTELFSGRRVRSPEDAAHIIRNFIDDSDREKFVVLGLSMKNEPTVLQVVHTGSINASLVHPRGVMKALILANCASCIVCHNHPSNDVTPSPEDIEVTERLVVRSRKDFRH